MLWSWPMTAATPWWVSSTDGSSSAVSSQMFWCGDVTALCSVSSTGGSDSRRSDGGHSEVDGEVVSSRLVREVRDERPPRCDQQVRPAESGWEEVNTCTVSVSRKETSRWFQTGLYMQFYFCVTFLRWNVEGEGPYFLDYGAVISCHWCERVLMNKNTPTGWVKPIKRSFHVFLKQQNPVRTSYQQTDLQGFLLFTTGQFELSLSSKVSNPLLSFLLTVIQKFLRKPFSNFPPRAHWQDAGSKHLRALLCKELQSAGSLQSSFGFISQ